MSYLNRTFIFSTLTLAIHSVAYATTLPNAGTITRDIKQESQPTAVQAVKLGQDLARERHESDNIEIAVSKIRLVGVEALSEKELATLLVGSEGKTVTLGQLRDLTEQITAYYNQQGYHLAKAVLPPQRIENGEVVIRVFEGKIAGVQLVNHSRLKDAVAQAYLDNGIGLGKALNRKQSARALLLLRDLAGVGEVNYSLAEGKQTGETALVANLEAAPLLSGNLSLDNHGSESTGEKRTRLNLAINNPFGRGERINLQGMLGMWGLNYGLVGLDLPLGYNGLSLNTSLSRTHYELGGAFENLNADGSSDNLNVGLRYPLLRSNQNNLWLAANGEWRRSKDRVRATQTETKKDIRLANFSLNGSFQDSVLAGGYSSINLQNTLGHLIIVSPEAKAIDAVSAKTAGSYYRLNLNLSRTQFFNQKWSLFANLNAQWSNKNLDSGEQLSLGGMDGVSAYRSGGLSGDKGVIGNLQLRYALNPNVTLSGFYDIGWAKLRNKPYTAEKNHQTLQGAGVGLNVQVKNLVLEAKSAWKINKPAGVKETHRVWLKASYYF